MNTKLILCGLSLLVLAACQQAPITTNYNPSSLIQGQGDIRVQPFTYAPADLGQTKIDQIPNTAIGQIHLSQPIGKYMSDAFSSEFKYAGYRLDQNKNILSGVVQEFKADDLGFNADWSLRISVDLKNKSGNALAHKEIVIQKRLQKFGEINVAVNSLIKEAFEQMMNDVNFKKHIQ
jgi:uncharacterized lipoprotein YajG